MTPARRSAIHFLVLIVFAVWTTVFVLGKAQEAIQEIEKLNQSYLPR